MLLKDIFESTDVSSSEVCNLLGKTSIKKVLRSLEHLRDNNFDPIITCWTDSVFSLSPGLALLILFFNMNNYNNNKNYIDLIGFVVSRWGTK